MTKRELNREIKRLYKRFLNRRKGNPDTSEWDVSDWKAYENREAALKAELYRLYHAGINEVHADQLRMLIIMNQSMRVIPLHHLASEMEVKV